MEDLMEMEDLAPRTLSKLLARPPELPPSAATATAAAAALGPAPSGADPVSSFITSAFGWTDGTASNMQLLFPNQPWGQQHRPRAFSAAASGVLPPVGSLAPFNASSGSGSGSGSAVLMSPFASLRPEFLSVGSSMPSGALPQASLLQQLTQQLTQQAGLAQQQASLQQQQQQQQQQLMGLPGSSSGAVLSPEQVLYNQQQCMRVAQQELMLRQAQALKQQQQQQVPVVTQAAPPAPQRQFTTMPPPPPQQPQQRKAAAGRSQRAPAAARAEQQDAPAAAAPAPRRRGRPVKQDGQYSEAYLALKRYRARKKNEMTDMEDELAAKKAQLLQLQRENRQLKDKHDALEHTLEAQDRIVHELSHLRIKAPAAADGGGGAAAAAAAAAAAGGSGAGLKQETDVSGSAHAAGQQAQAAAAVSTGPDGDAVWSKLQRSAAASAAASALVAAVTGEPQPDDAAAATAASGGGASSTGGGVAAAAAAATAMDWASIRPAQQPSMQFMQPHPAQEDCMDVAVLLERYKSYVAGAAAALARLAAALPSQQQLPGSGSGDHVPLAAVGQFTCEQAADLGVVLPPWPWTLAEYLAMGNDERIPPSLPACNLLTGQHESIEAEIWQTVATQVQLRPWQVGKLTAAWQLYESALQHITEKRVVLLERLRAALQQAAAAVGSDGSSAAAAAAVAAAAGASTTAAAAAGAQEDADGDINFFAVDSDEEDAAAGAGGGGGLAQRLRLHSRITGAQLDVLLSTDEYHALCEGINANLAREDSIMILFDYAIGNMLDELQLAIICVSSWPFMPLLGSISRWLVEPHLAADGGLLCCV